MLSVKVLQPVNQDGPVNCEAQPGDKRATPPP